MKRFLSLPYHTPERTTEAQLAHELASKQQKRAINRPDDSATAATWPPQQRRTNPMAAVALDGAAERGRRPSRRSSGKSDTVSRQLECQSMLVYIGNCLINACLFGSVFSAHPLPVQDK